MYLSKRSNGIYYLWYEDDLGRPQKVSTRCTTKSAALQFVRTFKLDKADRETKLQRISLSQFKAEYLQYSKGVHTPKTQRHFAVAFNELIRVIGDMPLHKIGVREVDNFLSVKKSEASVWTARKYYTALASSFEKALSWNAIQTNPFRKVKKPKAPEMLPVFLTVDDFRRLLLKVDSTDHKELFVTAFATGMRLTEILTLEWLDIDFIRKVIFIRNKLDFTTKSKRNRVIPMSEGLLRILKRRRKHADPSSLLVFTNTKGTRLAEDTPSRIFKNAVRDANLNIRLHFHSLRHSFASNLVTEGASLYAVQNLLGHSSSKTTEIYAHLLPEQLHTTVDKIHIPMR